MSYVIVKGQTDTHSFPPLELTTMLRTGTSLGLYSHPCHIQKSTLTYLGSYSIYNELKLVLRGNWGMTSGLDA